MHNPRSLTTVRGELIALAVLCSMAPTRLAHAQTGEVSEAVIGRYECNQGPVTPYERLTFTGTSVPAGGLIIQQSHSGGACSTYSSDIQNALTSAGCTLGPIEGYGYQFVCNGPHSDMSGVIAGVTRTVLSR